MSNEELFNEAQKFKQSMENFAPHLIDELMGIAEGSELPLEKIMFLNLRPELTYQRPEYCTSFAISGANTLDGSPLIGQNMDLYSKAEDQGVILHLKPKTGPNILCWSLAGVVGQTGINSYGLARVGNGLTSIHWRNLGTPYHFLLRVILEQKCVGDAIEVIREAIRTKSSNILLADSNNNIADVEFTAYTDRTITPFAPGFLAHSNHYLHEDLVKYDRGVTVERPDSPWRFSRMKDLVNQGLLHEKVSLDDVKKWLKDHINFPRSICRHKIEGNAPGSDIKTIASLIAEPSNGSLYACVGNPCENEYKVYVL
jgi:isopenicillin-N N-acyltransferase-like protein